MDVCLPLHRCTVTCRLCSFDNTVEPFAHFPFALCTHIINMLREQYFGGLHPPLCPALQAPLFPPTSTPATPGTSRFCHDKTHQIKMSKNLFVCQCNLLVSHRMGVL